MIRKTTAIPKTASLFLSRRFQASFQSEVPATTSAPASAVRTSPSPTAVSGKACISSPARARTGASGGVPRGVSAGLLSAPCDCERPSSVGTCGVLSSLMASVPYARVNEGVGDVNRQVEYENRDGDEGDDADYERLVAVQVRVDEVVAEARHREYALDDHSAGDEYCERGASERDDGPESSAQRVTHNHLALAQALRPPRADVVRAQGLR